MCKKELGLKPRLASFVVLIRLQGRRNALAIVGLHILWFSINQPPLRWIFDKAFDAQTEIINDRLFDALQVDTSRHALTQLSCDTSMDIYIYSYIYIIQGICMGSSISAQEQLFHYAVGSTRLEEPRCLDRERKLHLSGGLQADMRSSTWTRSYQCCRASGCSN